MRQDPHAAIRRIFNSPSIQTPANSEALRRAMLEDAYHGKKRTPAPAAEVRTSPRKPEPRPEGAPKKLTRTDERIIATTFKILRFLAGSGIVKRNDIERASGLKASQSNKRLHIMEGEGLIFLAGHCVSDGDRGGRSNLWAITEEGRAYLAEHGRSATEQAAKAPQASFATRRLPGAVMASSGENLGVSA